MEPPTTQYLNITVQYVNIHHLVSELHSFFLSVYNGQLGALVCEKCAPNQRRYVDTWNCAQILGGFILHFPSLVATTYWHTIAASHEQRQSRYVAPLMRFPVMIGAHQPLFQILRRNFGAFPCRLMGTTYPEAYFLLDFLQKYSKIIFHLICGVR